MFVGRRILIVGGGLAGLRTCEALRAEGFDGEIEMLCGEGTPPYDRPPLSKAALAERRDTTFDVAYDALGVDLRVGVRATGLDRDRHVVLSDTGEHPYDALVVATGATPVILPGSGRQHVLRTAADADALRAALRPGTRLTLVGAGWINAEIATTAHALGCSVTVLESAPAPLHQPLGPEIAHRMLPWWEHVDMRCGVAVAEISDAGPVLADGSLVESDLVVTGIGVGPDVAWLAGSGLDIDRGVVVDEQLRTADPAVFAVGDVAARWSPRYRSRIVGQHWDDARTAPATIAAALFRPDRGLVFDPVPYFWSDQFGHKIQFVGHRDPSDRMVFREGRDGKWGAAWIDDSSRLTAHLSIDSPRHMVQARMAIDRGAVVDPEAIGDLDTPVQSMPLHSS
ncbi:NAD(P)/FAD-dependent oxidoreductase [Rhodococcus rhodochrous]|uniref:NAD(P)/FAD-dependent oxidoreductase n=1 Tax=Rhodococcus rhodochrous TaxID=1829 RepID=A0AAW4XNE5_RHORH|nr:FAD/NAD(P)-binding oxidoreductase [Rhodococcus rhodochrous]MCD2114160.1 NAD(P)/FAD-dependent oxidoreductase [Rhodococcus rhodochrous]